MKRAGDLVLSSFLWFVVFKLPRQLPPFPRYFVFVGWLDTTSSEYLEMIDWLNDRCPGEWSPSLPVQGKHIPELVSVVGFQNSDLAMEFKLTYGKSLEY
jgi:hypothetical protein